MNYVRQIFFISALAATHAAPAFSAPITFNTALPVSEDELLLRELFIFTDASGPGVQINDFTAVTVGGYGINSKWSVFGVVPLTHINTDFGGIETDSFGLGDATLFSRYEVFRRDSRGRTVRLAPLAGIRLPTGETGETSDGSTDVFGGLVATFATTKINIGSQLVYTLNGEANGFEAGDTVALDAALQYRAWNGDLGGSTPAFVFAGIEGNITSQTSARLDGLLAPDSGGESATLSPGLQLVTERWIADIAVTIPIADNFNSDTINRNYSVLAGVRVNF